MTENEKIELFDKWYDENYDEWAEGEEGIALREELEQAFKGGIAELEKKNADLKEEINKIAFVRGNLEEENAELKLKLEALEGQTPWKDIKDKSELIKENAELKALVSQYKVSKCSGISLANRNMIMSVQLTKAKEIIKEFVEWANWQDNSKCPSFKSIQEKAEQFLREVEK